MSDQTFLSAALTPVSEQVGQHILTALQTEETVAVLSTIVPGVGPGQDRVVSLPLTSAQMGEVQMLLAGIAEEPEEEVDRKCMGFQCRLPAEE
jgi:hypothetical protein